MKLSPLILCTFVFFGEAAMAQENQPTKTLTLEVVEQKSIYIAMDYAKEKIPAGNFNMLMRVYGDHILFDFFEKNEKYSRGGGGRQFSFKVLKNNFEIFEFKESLSR